MRIDRLELVNFRGFERLELELHPRLTLLIGVNGSGKSNALEGLAEIEGHLGHDDPTIVGLQWELHDLEVHGASDPEAKGT